MMREAAGRQAGQAGRQAEAPVPLTSQREGGVVALEHALLHLMRPDHVRLHHTAALGSRHGRRWRRLLLRKTHLRHRTGRHRCRWLRGLAGVTPPAKLGLAA